MTTLRALWPVTQQFQAKNGSNLVGGKIYIYYQGRTALATTYNDEDGKVVNSNPVLLDNNGRATVFADTAYSYTIVVCDYYGKELFSQDITLHDVTETADEITLIGSDGSIRIDTSSSNGVKTFDMSANTNIIATKKSVDDLDVRVKKNEDDIKVISGNVENIATEMSGKKDKQSELTFNGSATKTIKKVIQNANGELNVEFEDIGLPGYNISSSDGSINVSTSEGVTDLTLPSDVVRDSAYTHIDAATANPLMNGTAAVGTSTKYAREDHVHPTDTSRASASHTHGSITNDGKIGTTADLPVITGTGGVVTTGSFSTMASAVGTSSASGTANTFSRGDHVHSISLATGDSDGQVKIAGSNVSVAGWGNKTNQFSLGSSSGTRVYTMFARMSDTNPSYDAEGQAILSSAGNYGLTNQGTWEIIITNRGSTASSPKAHMTVRCINAVQAIPGTVTEPTFGYYIDTTNHYIYFGIYSPPYRGKSNITVLANNSVTFHDFGDSTTAPTGWTTVTPTGVSSAVKADKADADGSGNNIVNTYATKTAVNAKQNKLTAGNNITIDGSTISSNQIFVATYGTTKYAEVKAAYDAGKLCTVFKDSRYHYISEITTDRIKFSTVSPNPNIYSLTLTKDNKWSSYNPWLQTHLTFDTAPTAKSKNPVTSDGIKTALDSRIPAPTSTTGTQVLKCIDGVVQWVTE